MPKSKRSRITCDAQVRNKIANGMGQICSSEPHKYVPFLLIHDFSSQGRSTSILSKVRIYLLRSGLETMCLRELQWNQNVIAIYEQVYLPREETTKIATELGIGHPTLSKDGEPYPMTTDLVAEIVTNGMIKQHAFAIKDTKSVTLSAADLAVIKTTKRKPKTLLTLEKLEIERRYWTGKGAIWSLVTDVHLCPNRASNIEHFQNAPQLNWTPHHREKVQKLALQAINTYPNRKVGGLARAIEQRFSVPAADVIAVLQQMCASRYLEFDINVPFGPDCHGRDFKRGPWTSADAFKQAAA